MNSKPIKEKRDTLAIAKASGSIVQAMEKKGIFSNFHTNFEDLKVKSKQLQGYHQTEQSSIDYFDFMNNGFWISLADKDQNIVGIQAVRLDMLGRGSLADMWRIQQPRIYDGGEIGKNHAPIVFELTGNIAYQGDMWIHKNERDNNLATLFTQLCILQALLRFKDLDYLYGFMRVSLAKKGFPYKTGFTYCVPNAVDWITEPNGINRMDTLVGISEIDIYHLAEAINTYGPESEVYTQEK
ncbi:hypothetical protein [Lentilitoribacter sp. Alg239-R112]|jgi:hypothetical protein|uniref:hypothetical protein n=1 Tax=Lentilitoribacter sp. Alg239-R112 TaxID=2305987 RepID=UPI0013A6CB0E|nr:hypothetical protein [Lentilitoribacter sp. Alg239-R112]